MPRRSSSHRFGPGGARRDPARGQALVEFSLVAIVFFLLFLAIVDFGHMVAMHSAAVTASRDAARYGSAVGDNGSGTLRYLDCAGMRTAARKVTGSLITLSDAQIAIRYDDGPGTSERAACGVGATASDVDRLDRIVVAVTLTYRPVTPLAALVPPITVVSIDRRTIVKQPT
jgi:Flp pilus assembly protein TadG